MAAVRHGISGIHAADAKTANILPILRSSLDDVESFVKNGIGSRKGQPVTTDAIDVKTLVNNITESGSNIVADLVDGIAHRTPTDSRLYQFFYRA